jgi:hypothetical protein
MKVARTVLNGGREETYRNATRLAPTQPGYRRRLKRGVAMTSDVKSRQRLFSGLHDIF